MSKSCCFVFVLAVICLSVILLSLETDAQPTVDESTTSCGSSASDEVVNIVKMIASNQQETSKEIKDMKKLLASDPNQGVTVQPSKQAFISGLVSNCFPLLIQQKVNGSTAFSRSWAEFKVGFNDSSGNYWLGNELLSQLTANNRYKLRFDLQRTQTAWSYAEYSTFRVLTETYDYELKVAGFSGNLGDALISHHNGMKFSTYDRDNDLTSGNCAVSRGGGFWYSSCGYCDVNGAGQYFKWSRTTTRTYTYPLQSSRMWLQCK